MTWPWKMLTPSVILSGFIALQLFANEVQGLCFVISNQTKGELTTPGFPDRLDTNDSTCFFVLNVGSGRIKLTFQNISLPPNSKISFSGFDFNVSRDELSTRDLYADSWNEAVIVQLPSNNTSGYKGLKISFERTPPVKPKYVIYIGIVDLLLAPGDDLTFYDGKTNTILAAYNRTRQFIRSTATNSSYVRVVLNSRDNRPSSGFWRYRLDYKLVPEGSCVEEYFSESGSVSSSNKSCVYIIRVPVKGTRRGKRILVRFENLFIPPGDYIVVTQTHETYHFTIKTLYLKPSDSRLIKYFASDVAIDSRVTDPLEIRFNSSARFDLTFKDATENDACPYCMRTFSVENDLPKPNYLNKNNTDNITCEYFIESPTKNKVVHIRIAYLTLDSTDYITFYDGENGGFLARYGGQSTLLKSVTSDSQYMRVVVRREKMSSAEGDFKIYASDIEKGLCLEEYDGESGNVLSSNKSCVYVVRAIGIGREIEFRNLYIPPSDTISVSEVQIYRDTILGKKTSYLTSKDSGSTKIFATDSSENRFEINFNSSSTFHLFFKRFQRVQSVNLNGSSGVLESPYYPQTYLENLQVTYHVRVPSGHVKLSFTELRLSRFSSIDFDIIIVYDGSSDDAEEIARFENNTVADLPVVFSSNNALTLYLRSDGKNNEKDVFRFRAIFTNVTEVPTCSTFNWPHTYASRNVTISGRRTKHYCEANYLRDDDPGGLKYIERECNATGDWKPGKVLKCARKCPLLSKTLQINSTLSWTYSTFKRDIREGKYVTFSCGYNWDMIGPNKILCTSRGNYSASPPICKKRPPKASDDDGDSSGVDSWIIGAAIGGVSLFIAIILAIVKLCSAPRTSSLGESTGVQLESVNSGIKG